MLNILTEKETIIAIFLIPNIFFFWQVFVRFCFFADVYLHNKTKQFKTFNLWQNTDNLEALITRLDEAIFMIL